MMKQYFDNGILLSEVAGLLCEGKTVTIPVRGNSMRPFLADGRDSVVLQRGEADRLERGDVVLATVRGRQTWVLHRIVARRGNRLTLQGDNNRETEAAEVKDVAGVAIAMVRKGVTYPVDGWQWRLYSCGWMARMSCRCLGCRCKNLLAYLWRILDGYRWSVLLSCLTGIFSVGLGLLFIYLSKLAIDAATAGQREEIFRYGAMLVMTTLLQLACNAADNWIAVRTQIRVGNAMRSRLLAHLLHSRWGELERFHTGDVVNRVESDASALVGLLTNSVPAFVIMGLQLLAALVFFCHLDARLPWIVVGVLPLFLLGGRVYMKRMYRHTGKLRQSDSRIQAIIQESLQQRSVVKALELGEGRLDKLDRQQESLCTRLMERTRFSILSRICVSAAFAGGYLAAFLWGVCGLSAGTISFGTMAAFLQLVGKIQQPVWDMARLVPSVVEGRTSVRRLRELETLAAEEDGDGIRFKEIPDVVVNNITFTYAKGDTPVFSGFSCRFPAGSRTAVVGETGKGKTTLLRLLLAFDVPQSGSIKLCPPQGGEEVPVSSRTRCNFTYVPQGNTLFSGTVRDNLRLGNPRATSEEMRRALHAAAADFVFALPRGLDTFIGEQGSGLSEGQAQRIAVARALLRNRPILLLDEATSALDEETERQLMENLEREYAGRTVIFITHHAAVAARCGQTIRIENEE